MGTKVESRVVEASAFREGKMMLNKTHEDRKVLIGINKEVFRHWAY